MTDTIHHGLLMLSLSKHSRFAGPKINAGPMAFDKLRLSGEWK